jgi:hypothetical protein
MAGGANAANAQLALGNIRGQQFSNAANALGQGYDFYKKGGFSNLFGGGGSGFVDIGGEGAAANRALAEYM